MNIDSRLVEGNALEQCGSDVIAQFTTIAVGTKVPEGWVVLTGNSAYSRIARIVMRDTIEIETD